MWGWIKTPLILWPLIFFVFPLTEQDIMEPEAQLVPLGLEAYFKCDWDNKTEWYYNGNPLPPEEVEELPGNQIKIRSVTKYNTGYYECAGTNTAGIYFRARGLLKVYGN